MIRIIILSFILITNQSFAKNKNLKTKKGQKVQIEEDYRGSVDLSEDGEIEEFQAVFQDALDQINQMKSIKQINPCSALLGSGNLNEITCAEKYTQIYNKPTVDFKIVFGYLDTQEGYTSDLTMREALVATLTTPCPEKKSNIYACGLSKDLDDADKFYKEVIDFKGEKHRVVFTIVNSSYSYSEEDNIAFAEQQKEQSQKAREAFLDGLQNASVIIYNGHSRDGGGPDFDPPVLKKNNHVDYNWYHKNKPGLKQILSALEEGKKAGKKAPAVMAFNSCNSHLHFHRSLSQAAPDSGLLMTTQSSYFIDEPYTTIGMINAILGQFCEPSFSASINGSPKIDKGSRIKAFNFP
ncbi:MAG: hypothetical protein KBD76_08240 [Bacteriovorax sp.]|jgi:hypothetical protein|nr:hypothetical protein [Bacteriovorax sp.]